MKYGSVCSGIEAASLAWESIGWSPVWFAEIEPFPSAVLAHHYPDVNNLGDMTTIAARVTADEVEAPDVLVGGTPCQAFSVAGLRAGLEDARGQLTLSYVELANAIDAKRRERGEKEAIIVWENVPGVLSSRDNAFGCFLAGLAGETDELQPPGSRWADVGCVYGPQRTITWVIKDAQYFEVAQRRCRVFVVASARKDIDPAKILFEFEGMRRDTPPSREKGQAVAGTISSRASAGGGLGTDFDCDGGLIPVSALTANGVGTCGADDNQALAGHLIAGTLQASGKAAGSATQQGAESGLLVAVQSVYGDVAHTLASEGADASEDGTGRGTPIIAYGGGNTSGEIDVAACLTTHGQHLDFDVDTFALAFPERMSGTQAATTENLSPAIMSRNPTAIAFSYKDHGADAAVDLSPTLRAGNHDRSHANSGQPPAVVYALQDTSGREKSQNGKGWNDEGISYTVDTLSTQGVATSEPFTLAVRGRADGSTVEVRNDGTANALLTPNGGRAGMGVGAIGWGMHVRRLTPRECERLQGMPDDHSLIPWRGKMADLCPDGPRYRAIGNSMAVPVMRWIGQRIDAAVAEVESKEPSNCQIVSFSGGRSSAYLVHLMELRRIAGEDVRYVFMDTGAEHPKTYEFIKNIVNHWNIDLTCLRVVVNPVLGQANGYKQISVDEIGYDLQLWRDICAKYGTPYIHGAFCTRTMKIEPFDRYCKENFADGFHKWIGIRADEPRRLKPHEGISYLADISDFDKKDVLDW